MKTTIMQTINIRQSDPFTYWEVPFVQKRLCHVPRQHTQAQEQHALQPQKEHCVIRINNYVPLTTVFHMQVTKLLCAKTNQRAFGIHLKVVTTVLRDQQYLTMVMLNGFLIYFPAIKVHRF